MERNLVTVPQFAASSPFTLGQLRFWIFDATNNGLADHDAVVRVRRRVYLDVAAFERWISSQNAKGGRQ